MEGHRTMFLWEKTWLPSKCWMLTAPLRRDATPKATPICDGETYGNRSPQIFSFLSILSLEQVTSDKSLCAKSRTLDSCKGVNYNLLAKKTPETCLNCSWNLIF